MTPEDIEQIASDEETRWKKTHAAVVEELKDTFFEYQQDRKLARELTAEMVATTRDEDKMALANDEAVAHGLTKLRAGKTSDLEELVKQPYFARVTTKEDGRQIEFKLGMASFPQERIVDWRKAPISRLYYDYKEGDEFCVTIQDREREGFVTLRRSYQGQKDNLTVIETAQGTLIKDKGAWTATADSDHFSRAPEHDGHLPPILSLITADQYDLISRDAEAAVIIQGIAGSGKTTVALHRLAWLLHHDNSDAKPEKCLVVMLNRSLKAYVEQTLPELNVTGVPILTYGQWSARLVDKMTGARVRGDLAKTRSVELFKSSTLCLQLLKSYVTKSEETEDMLSDLFGFLKFLQSEEPMWIKWSEVKDYITKQIAGGICDFQDDSILLHLYYLRFGTYPWAGDAAPAELDHLVIDEIQDFGIVEIRALLQALSPGRAFTLVGDEAQKIISARHFGSWNELLEESGIENTVPVTLTVSHRSTVELMRLANHLRGTAGDAEHASAGRNGPTPLFIRVDHEVNLPRQVGKWIDARLLENNRSLIGIICRKPAFAQQLVESLRKIGYPSVRLGHRDQFDFSPGITVTSAAQVKGLEFRNVLVVEPGEANYRTDEERNLLYVAVTRAESRLDFVGCTPPTKLLPRLEKTGDASEDVRT